MTFGEKLEKLQADRGVSDREIARRVGVSANTIANWTAGESEPRLSQAVDLARYFGVPVSYLALDDEPEPVGQMPADETAVLFHYRMLRKTRGLNVEEAMARLDGAAAVASRAPSGAAGEDEDAPGERWPRYPRAQATRPAIVASGMEHRRRVSMADPGGSASRLAPVAP